MPRGVKAKTKAERIRRLKALKWSNKAVLKAVKCSKGYLYAVLRKIAYENSVAGLMMTWESDLIRDNIRDAFGKLPARQAR